MKSLWKQSIYSKLSHPGSFILFLITVFAAAATILVLGFLLIYILIKGVPYLKPELFSLTYDSNNVSMLPALINTLLLTGLALMFAVPTGIGAAVYMAEYARPGNQFVKIVRITAETLSGIPSIIYGLFGMLFFVTVMRFGYSLLSGAFTAAIMALPLIMRTAEEALLSVPRSYREGSFGLGAGKLRTVFRIVLPSAIPGILSGIILAAGRIVGETAAFIYTAGTVAKIPSSVFSSARTLSVHMYSLSKEGLHTGQAYATAVVLLIFVIGINLFANTVAGKLKVDGIS